MIQSLLGRRSLHSIIWLPSAPLRVPALLVAATTETGVRVSLSDAKSHSGCVRTVEVVCTSIWIMYDHVYLFFPHYFGGLFPESCLEIISDSAEQSKGCCRGFGVARQTSNLTEMKKTSLAPNAPEARQPMDSKPCLHCARGNFASNEVGSRDLRGYAYKHF